MTKEEIIIDGVNVKDCKRRIGKNSYCRYFKRPCADNNFNCIWKQHERLKEENKQLQKRFNDYQDRKIEENANLMKELDIADKKLTVFSRELEQANKENEKLKKILQELENLSLKTYDVADFQMYFDNLRGKNDD